MIRIVVQRVKYNHEGRIIGRDFRTFDVDHPELERELRSNSDYEHRTVSGAEILEPKP